MAQIVIMPKQGQSVESCIITKWNKQTGDEVHIGDLLFSYETDKAAFEEEAKAEGKLLAILAEEGDDVPCLNDVCIIGKDGEDISALLGREKINTIAPAEEKTETQISAVASPAVSQNENERVFISPRAKMAAERQGVDAAQAIPTGANGRVIEQDIYKLSPERKSEEVLREKVAAAVEIAKQAGMNQAEFTEEKLSNVRKVIAKTMQASLSTMAQLTHHTSFDATKILEYRKQIKAKSKDMAIEDITLNDMILFAVSRVLKNHSGLNAHLLDDKIRYFAGVNLGVAVDTERGLLVPTLFNADQKSLNQISREAKELIKAAQSGKIDPELLKNGTFTITNLGSLGIESFTPIINPPQTGILGINTVITRIKEVNGEIKPYPAMGLSLTYDHRAIDGAPASRFLKELVNALENFDIMLAM